MFPRGLVVKDFVLSLLGLGWLLWHWSSLAWEIPHAPCALQKHKKKRHSIGPKVADGWKFSAHLGTKRQFGLKTAIHCRGLQVSAHPSHLELLAKVSWRNGKRTAATHAEKGLMVSHHGQVMVTSLKSPNPLSFLLVPSNAPGFPKYDIPDYSVSVCL